MSEHRWEWKLPGGEQVAATLDPTSGIESVYVDGRPASQSARGAKPDGHVVPLLDPPPDSETVIVSFDPRIAICVLRVGREEIAPMRWPQPRRGKADAAPPPDGASLPLGAIGIAVVVVVLAVVAGYGLFKRAPSESRAMTGVHRAENGLFVAHFPTTFEARAALVPSGTSGVVIEDRARSEAVVILAMTVSDVLGDPWAIQKRAHGEALANLPRGGGDNDEISRVDGTCLGEPGAIVVGRVTSTSGSRASVWSCAFRRGAAGYVVMYSHPETDIPSSGTRLRGIIDSTELTRLEDMKGGRL